MRYLLHFIYGVIKALLWSGGWYWRIPFIILLLPVIYFQQTGHLIPGIDLGSGKQWLYLSIIMGLFALGLAARIASLETPKITATFEQGKLPCEQISSYKNGTQKRLFSFNIKNISGRELDQCLVKIIDFKSEGGSELGESLPVPVRSEYKMGGGKSGRFILSPGEAKTVPIVSYLEGNPPQPIYVIYQRENLFNEVISSGKYECQIGIYSEGAPIKMQFQFYVENDRLIFRQKN